MVGHRQCIDTADMRNRGSINGRNIMRVICSIILLGCSPILLLHAQQTDVGASGTIRSLEREWVDAQSRNNNRALDLILDNSVVYVEYGHLVSKADYLLRIKHQDPSTDEIVMEPITVRVFGSTAIVTGSYRETQRKAGTHTVTRWRFVDTWAYKKYGWVLIAAGSTPVRD